ncbi:glycoside hydrolase family 31 protein [Alkalihalobacillus macyae]|uniref:glycoside hydrolase family 31 protein n=1 Tax=Guptibacillus hwajinpoensis TaxID=208199 RepID=UPI00273C7306|nr:glycoside hydrolase family 31 protein [Alkalihalobacillus macyae]MDP4552299.1 glycoside hydrolase family 31 protein [Alkalihalobacillus macyae]
MKTTLKKTFLSSALALSMVITAAAPQTLAVTQPHPDEPLNKQEAKKMMKVQSVKKLDNGIMMELDQGQKATIRLFAEDLVKVSILENDKEEKYSPGIAKKDWETPEFEIEEKKGKITLKTDEITVMVNKEPFGVKMLDKEGNVINEDAMNYGSGYADDKPYVFKKTEEDENFYGFGEQSGEFNKRGESIGMFNTDAYAYGKDTKYLYTSIPFFIGLKDEKAYGIFFDNTYRTYFEMASESDDYYYFYADGGELTYYMMYGPEIQNVLDRYTELTGKMPKPAKWTLGLHQSKWQYSADDIERVAETYREKEIPLDTMHFDIDYMDEFRVFTWADDFGSEELHNNLDNMNFHKIAINDPAVKYDEDYRIYKEGTENDYWAKNPDGSTFFGEVWPGKSAFPDFSKPEVRDWWALNSNVLFDKGIDGIWNDMNEPAVFDGPYHTMPLDIQFGEGENMMLHEEYHNLYGHDEAEATYNAFLQHKPNVRPFVLTRDMYAGTQRYAALWTGDNVSEWEHLQLSLPMNMNVGLSGQPFVGNDIGGFASRPDAELFARWIEVGAFLPFSRIHYDSDGKSEVEQAQEPWEFGPEVEEISKKYIELRYKLMPYLYNAFNDAAETGSPVQQPLVYQFQEDERTYDINDQFMFGESLMAAPVVEEGVTERDVYLPEDALWVDFWTGEEFEGGQTISRDADLGTMPLYVKQDSIVPTREVQQYTGELSLENLILDTYLEDEATYSFYEDDGATEDYKDGEYNMTNFKIEKKNKKIEFTTEQEVQDYETELSSYTLKLHDQTKPKKVQAASNKYKEVKSVEKVKDTNRSYYYDENERILYVNVPTSENKKLQIKF